MKLFNTLAMLLTVIGGINWGLVGLLKFNLVDFLFGGLYVDRIIYVAIGVSALYLLFAWKSIAASRSGK